MVVENGVVDVLKLLMECGVDVIIWDIEFWFVLYVVVGYFYVMEVFL